MIRRLKRRFVTIAMLSLLGVLMVVLTTVNLLFWHNSMEMSDSMLTYLAQNDGGFEPRNSAPEKAGRPEKPEGGKNPRGDTPHMPGFLMNPETAFRTRCFSVTCDTQGNVLSTRTDRIAAVTEDEAINYAEKVLKKGRDRGMTGIYRYYIEYRETETVAVFLDCNDLIMNSMMLLFLSGVILLFCLAAMWILLWIFSGKAIRPAIESMEKQRQFIADAGHELKTPLTIINADAAVLAMTGEDNEWVGSIRSQTRRLEGLVHELLDLPAWRPTRPSASRSFP